MVGCSQNPCRLISDQNGHASVQLLVKDAGASVITATLPTGGTVSATVNGVLASLEITLAQPNVHLVSGSTLTIPVTATVVSNGKPAAGKTVDWLKNYGKATISPGSSVTKADGTASSNVSVSVIVSDVNISACVAPTDAPCRTLLIHPVAAADLRLQKVSGDGQVINVGQTFRPVVVRVTNQSGNPVAGAPVTFDVHVYRAPGSVGSVISGEVATTNPSDPAVLSSALVQVSSDVSGLATLPGVAVPNEAVLVKVRASVGSVDTALQLRSKWAGSTSGRQSGKSASTGGTAEAARKLKTSRGKQD
jgi:hypothetical protein